MSSFYKINRASFEDIDEIMSFINTHWRKDHILSKDKLLFEREFKDDSNLNFILAIDKNNKITGCLGYMKSNSKYMPDIWTSIWVVAQKRSDPTLGIKLFMYLQNKIPHRYLLAAGVNPDTLPYYDRFGIQTGFLKQHYMLNDKIKNHKIAKVQSSSFIFPWKNETSNKNLTQIYNIEDLKENYFLNENIVPYKDYNYIKKRYFDYPHHTYSIFSVSEGKRFSSLFVTREILINESKALIVVDFIGDQNDIVDISEFLKIDLFKNNYEFITFLEFGLNKENLEKSNFQLLDFENDKIIIPIYFSPLIKKNKIIYYFADNIDKKYFIFKADGDQDRPN